MTHPNRNPQVDEYFNNAKKWQAEMEKLRTIVLECQLTEEMKWKQPCYTFQNRNILIITEVKQCCSLNFFNGALLTDAHGLLSKPGENTQAGRQIRFTNIGEILEMETVLKAYIHEAIEVEKAGLKVEFKKTTEFPIPEELHKSFEQNLTFKTAFEALTPGRQRAYLMYFAEPKQSQTRESRIEKSMERIFNGKGLLDCTCGHSKRMPSCDGSHKYFR